MTHWIASDDEEAIHQYWGPRHAARRYARLLELNPGSVQAQDVSRERVDGGDPTSGALGRAIDRMSEWGEIHECFMAARDRVIAARARGERYWEVWWAVRVEGAEVKDRDATGYSEAQAHRVVKEVESFVWAEMEDRDLIRRHPGFDEQEALNKAWEELPPEERKARIAIDEAALDAFYDDEEE